MNLEKHIINGFLKYYELSANCIYIKKYIELYNKKSELSSQNN